MLFVFGRPPLRSWLLAACLLFPICGVLHEAAAASPKRILILHSFGRDFKPWSEYGNAIRADLNRPTDAQVDIFDQSLLALRSGDEEVESKFVEYLTALYSGKPLDLIIGVGAPAATFVQRHRDGFFADVPMILTAVDERRLTFTDLTPNDVAVAVHIDYLRAFENILRLLPDTENIIVVVGTSPIEKFWKEAITKQVAPLSGKIKISWTDHLPFSEFLQIASNLPPRTAIFWELMIVDAAGVIHEGEEPMAQLYEVANAPMFSYDESFFGPAIVGGPLLKVVDTSRETVAAATRLLAGEKAETIKVATVQFGSPIFDWRQLQRWNIPESRLPPGSQVLYRDFNAWERYRWQIIAIGLAVALQASLINWLLWERRQRRQFEAVSRNTMAELARVNRVATGNELSGWISHEVMQPLTGIVASANAGLRWLSSSSPDVERARAMLDQIVAAGHRAADVVTAIRAVFKREETSRQIVSVNRIVDEVLDLVGADLNDNDVRVETALSDRVPMISADPVQLQQLFLNLILNAIEAMKGVTPKEIGLLKIRTSPEAHGVGIQMEDSGIGIEPRMLEDIFEPFVTTKREGIGLGLSICRSIVEVHHGRIHASIRQPRGLSIHVYLPAEQPET